MYLLDSNILLELILDQDRADEVEQFLRARSREDLHISEFTLYSVGIVLFRRKHFEAFLRLVNDFIIRGGVHLLQLAVQDMESLALAAQRFALDFDDAYQYVVAGKYGLEILSFDSDFDRTDKGRKTPDQIGG